MRGRPRYRGLQCPGQATGRFTIPDAEIALSAVAGGLIGLLLRHALDPERVTDLR
jgi:hypothetical protein